MSGAAQAHHEVQQIGENKMSLGPEEQISKLKDKLEYRNRFFRMVIHDLRGPATSIQMGCDIALKEIKQSLRSRVKRISLVNISSRGKARRSFQDNQGRN